jgi:hypothetical protein
MMIATRLLFFGATSVSPESVIYIQLGSLTAASLIMLLGLALLAMANVAKGRINPAPRWIFLTCGMLSSAALCGLYILFFIALPLPRRYRSYSSLSNLMMPLSVTATVLSCVTWLFALLYALQIANWLRSRKLAIASACALGLQLLRALAIAGNTLLSYAGFSPGFWQMQIVQIFLNALQMLAMIVAAAYFLALAFRLAKRA